MKWNDHEKLRGLHAFLGASQFRWITWDDEKLIQRYYSSFASDIGTALHDLAQSLIKNKIKLTLEDTNLIELTLVKAGFPRGSFDSEKILHNLLPYVNDAIGFRMDTEVILYYSPYSFGTADAIKYDDLSKKLRIHDYKSGGTPAHMEQLEIYAALFCLEYNVDPFELKDIELRIYQNYSIPTEKAESERIKQVMHLIIENDRKLKKLRED